jgi:hypothetical protein
MSEPELYDDVICIVKGAPFRCGGIDYYEVIVKDSGKQGSLLCRKMSLLLDGQEFTAQFVTAATVDGRYILQNPMCERNGEGKFVLKPEFEPPSIPGGGRLIHFPERRNETLYVGLD